MIDPIAGNELDFQEFIKTLRNYPHDVTTLKTFWNVSKKIKACLFIRGIGPCRGQILLFNVEELPKFIRGEPYKKQRQGFVFCPIPKGKTFVFYQYFTNEKREDVPIQSPQPTTPKVIKRGKYGSRNRVPEIIRESSSPKVS